METRFKHDNSMNIVTPFPRALISMLCARTVCSEEVRQEVKIM